MDTKCDEKKGTIFSISPEKLSQSTVVLTEKPPKDSKLEDENEDTLCGIGSWTPKWIQGAANPKLFLFFYSMAGLTQGAHFTYLVGCISTLEKRFAYDTKKSGILMISDELAPILLGALIGYFGGLANRPRLLTFGMLIGSLSSFIMALPYFIYGSGSFDENLKRSVSRIPGVNSQFCDKDYNELGDSCSTSITTPVLSIFIFSNFLKGLSGVIFYTIGTSYIDDSVKKKNSPLYFGK